MTAKTGLTYIVYKRADGSYNEIQMTINGKSFSVPVIGNIDAARDKQLCEIINNLIKRELK